VQFWNTVMTDGKLMPPFHEWRDAKVAEGKKTICLRHAVFNPPGSGSPITKDKGLDSKCRDNSIVRGFASYTLQRMGVFTPPKAASQPLVVRFISRKDYSFNTNMNMQRKIDNEPEVLPAFRITRSLMLAVQVVSAIQAKLGPAAAVSRIDFAEKSWKEQVPRALLLM
jgi:hypothetical protein